MDRRTGLLALAFVLLWNSGFIGAEYVLPHAGPFTQLFWRYLALATILCLGLAVGGRLCWPGKSVAGAHGLIGVLAHAVWLGAVLLSLQAGVPAGMVALVVALQPLATGVFSGRVTGEPTTLRRWLGLSVGFIGVGFTVVWRVRGGASEAWGYYLLPFLAALAMTAATLIQRRLELRSPRFRLALGPALFYQCAASALVLLPPALLAERLRTEWSAEFFAGLAWLIGAVSLGAYGLMWELLKRIDSARVASLFYFGPPVTMLMAWIAFGDELRWTDGLGLGLVLLGVVLAQDGSKRVS